MLIGLHARKKDASARFAYSTAAAHGAGCRRDAAFPLTSDGFGDGLANIEAVIAAERSDPAIDPRCLSYVLHHNSATERAIVLFHGFTNCPRQFAAFADLLHACGWNVYVPRLPRHGLLDKITPQLAGLTAVELIDCARQAARFGSRLGSRLSVLGLSVGATLAAWLAQNDTLDRAVAIAPFFSVVRVPTLLEPFLAGALDVAPNIEIWWDPRVKEKCKPDHAYPRFATHALAQCLQLGEQVRNAAREASPSAARAILVLNAKDPAIDNAAARDIWSHWRTHGAAIEEYTFENLDVRHDIIEPVTFPAAATLVYPVLLQLLGPQRPTIA